MPKKAVLAAAIHNESYNWVTLGATVGVFPVFSTLVLVVTDDSMTIGIILYLGYFLLYEFI